MSSSDVPVLVVGAGPAGLVAALNLAKNGVIVRFIDKDTQFHRGSRGPGIQPRSLELFHFLGVLPDIRERGMPLNPHRVYKVPGGREIIEEGWMAPQLNSTPSTPYPNLLLLSQMNLEEILRNHLAKFGVHVELGTELRTFEQHDNHVIAHLIKYEDEKETEETVTCDWLIGTDGGRGVTRKLLGLDFIGISREDVGTVVGDIEVEGLSQNYWHSWGDLKSKMVTLRPMELPGRFSLVIGGQVNYAPLIRDLDALVKFMYEATDRRDLKFGTVHWIGEFRPNVRMVDNFVKGRVFIAGDAAHVHSFTGGQGLNASVHDAFNLTWKLALVIKGASPPSLLSSYTDERSPVIRAMLGYTTALLDKLKDASGDVQGSTVGAWRRRTELKQLGVNYRWSEIVRDERAPKRPVEELHAFAYGGASTETEAVEAGDRGRDAPHLRVLAGGTDGSTRLFDIFGPTYHTVLLFADSASAEQVEATVKALTVYSVELVRVVVIYPRGSKLTNDAVANVLRVADEKGHAYQGYSFDATQAEPGKLPTVVVRPDGVVGAVVFGEEGVEQYFTKIFREGAVKIAA